MSCQQFEIYGAEELLPKELGLQTLDLEEAQGLVDSWRKLAWWEQNFSRLVYVQVVERRARRGGSCGGLVPIPPAVQVAEFADRLQEPHLGVVEMAPHHMNALFLAHEVSHVLAASRYNSQAHCPWFARTYLQLAYLGVSPDAYKRLYEELERAGVDHRIDE